MFFCINAYFLVEATGLEPTTSWSLTKRATKLRYASISLRRHMNSITYYTYPLSFSQAFFIDFLTFFKNSFFKKANSLKALSPSIGIPPTDIT